MARKISSWGICFLALIIKIFKLTFGLLSYFLHKKIKRICLWILTKFTKTLWSKWKWSKECCSGTLQSLAKTWFPWVFQWTQDKIFSKAVFRSCKDKTYRKSKMKYLINFNDMYIYTILLFFKIIMNNYITII